MPPHPQPHSGPEVTTPRTRRYVLVLAAIMALAAALRCYHLGRLSLWYDEVIPMRLARQATPSGLFRLLFEIEATRAPLHPLALQVWLRIFGPSDLAGRALAAACGLLTITIVWRIGRRLFGPATGLWGAWLCTWSPLLVAYSQEVKMYSWLVLWACISWDRLLSLRESAPDWKLVTFGLSQAAVFYSHPLGGFIIAAQGFAFLATRRAFALSLRRWLVVEAALVCVIAPWLPNYLDHPPEYVLQRLSLKYLLGLPIGFIGGDFRALAVCVGLAVIGLLEFERRDDGSRRLRFDRPSSSIPLLIWFALPPVALYLYSLVAHPIFGPARYTLFVGPAYLLLVARGLVKLPGWARYPLALAGAALAVAMLGGTAYSPDFKADWRTAAALIRSRGPAPVFVVSADPTRNREVETARYYLDPSNEALPAEDAIDRRGPGRFWIAVGTPDGVPAASIPGPLRWLTDGPVETFDLPGLRLLGVGKE